MGIFILLIALLICAAVVYGVFFLIFKIIWLIAKKEGNKWPLWLAGAATAVLAVAVTVAVYSAYNLFAKPFTGLINSAMQKTAVSYDSRPYKDPRFGFTLNKYGSLEFSDWIHYEDVSIKVGFDTNTVPLSRQAQTVQERQNVPMSALAILRVQEDETPDLEEEFDDTLEMVQQSVQSGQFELQDTQYVTIGSRTGLLVSGIYSDPRRPDLMLNVYLLNVVDGRDVYYLISIVKGDPDYNNEAIDSLLSFRPGSEPTPAKRANPAAQHITGFVPTDVIMD